MSNPIKYSTGSETLALKKGNFYIGTGDVGKGPTSSTGYYNGISPPTGGYTIYLNKETNGPSIYTASNDAQLISLTNSIAGQSYTTANECLVYFAGQTDKMVLNRNYEGIVTNGLILNLDAGFVPSYPKSGVTWSDLSLNGNNGTLVNGPTFNSNDGGTIVFDGSDDFVTVPDSSSLNFTSGFTVEFWVYIVSYGGGGTMLMHQQSGGGFGGFEVYVNSGSVVLFNKNADVGLTGVGGFTRNTWVNVVCTADGINAKIYLNSTLGANSLGGLPDDVNGQFRIGSWSGGGYLLNGRMSTVRLYNRALLQSEITQNFNAQKGRFGL
jgi:hypothetical protein